jgi:hypothetical protein
VIPTFVDVSLFEMTVENVRGDFISRFKKSNTSYLILLLVVWSELVKVFISSLHVAFNILYII